MNKKVYQSFSIIENLAYWEGGLNASILGAFLGIAPSNARKYIKEYQTQYPKNLIYNSSNPEKLFEAQPEFECKVITGKWADYVQFISANKTYQSFIDLGPHALQHVQPSIFRQINFAIRKHNALTIIYHSRSRPDGRIRVIHPHAIASSGLRWHCRAYDPEDNEYKDFNLGRIGKVIRQEPSEPNHSNDLKWFKFESLVVGPNNKLDDAFQAIVMRDYGREKNFTIKIRQSMVPYFLQFHNVSIDVENDNPHEKPLMLVNANELHHCLF